MAKFQIFKDKAGEYRWRLRANNNEIIAASRYPERVPVWATRLPAGTCAPRRRQAP